MITSSLTATITESFYAWELRGRGWTIADYPVRLEPPYRPFFLIDNSDTISNIARTPYDDGKRPTLLSSFIDGVRTLFTPTPVTACRPAFVEQQPFEVESDIPRTTLQIHLPANYSSDVEIGKQLILSFATALYPVSYELIGTRGTVTIQCSVADTDKVLIIESIRGYAPTAVVVECEDLLESLWDPSSLHQVVDFGLADEFFLPLRIHSSLSIDPYIALVTALAQTQDGEMLAVQILMEQAHNPWSESINNALSDGEGGCIIDGEHNFLQQAREKTRSPMYAVVIRVAVQALHTSRVYELLRSTQAFFLQSDSPNGNALAPLENADYSDECHEFAFHSRQSFRTGMILCANELVGLLHLPDASVTYEALIRDTRRTKALPYNVQENDKNNCILGENTHRGVTTLATLSVEQRLKHVHVVGATGSGKSTLLLGMFAQDIAEGRGVAMIDPHGDLVDDILKTIPIDRKDDVIFIDPSDAQWSFGFNILDAQSEQERELVASDMVGIFKRFSTTWGDVMHTVLANALLAIMEHPTPSTLLTLRRFLVEDAYRKNILTNVTDPAIRYFWEMEFPSIGIRSIGPILTRLDSFLRSKLIRRMVGQSRAEFNVQKAMKSNKIVLAKLSHGQIGEENAYLLGSLLVSKFHQAALSRQGQEHSARNPYFLYIDEVQHFVTPSMGTLITGVRKYGLGLTVAHQSIAQIERVPEAASALLDNAYTRMVFRVGENDAKRLANGFSSFDADDLQNLRTGEAIIRIGIPAHDCNIHTIQREMNGGQEAQVADIIDLSRNKYASAASVVDRELGEYFVKPEKVQTTPSIKKAETLPSRENECAQKDAPFVSIPRAIFSPITEIKPPPIEATPGRGGQEHKYLQHLIVRLAQERGFRATTEDTAGNGRADVVLKKEGFTVACEISITTSVEHEIANVQKCIAAGFTHIIFICKDQKRREKVRKGFPSTISEHANITYIAPEDIVATLDNLDQEPKTTEGVVRGYKVKVSRQNLSASEVTSRRVMVAGVIAKALSKGKYL